MLFVLNPLAQRTSLWLPWYLLVAPLTVSRRADLTNDVWNSAPNMHDKTYTL